MSSRTRRKADKAVVPKFTDDVLNEWIIKYHEHDSLLSHIEEESLTEDERKAAWDEFENEKEGRQGMNMVHMQIANLIQQGNNYIAISGQQTAIDMKQIAQRLSLEEPYKNDPVKLVTQLATIVQELRTRVEAIRRESFARQQAQAQQQQSLIQDLIKRNQPVPPALLQSSGLLGENSAMAQMQLLQQQQLIRQLQQQQQQQQQQASAGAAKDVATTNGQKQ